MVCIHSGCEGSCLEAMLSKRLMTLFLMTLGYELQECYNVMVRLVLGVVGYPLRYAIKGMYWWCASALPAQAVDAPFDKEHDRIISRSRLCCPSPAKKVYESIKDEGI